MQIEQHWLSYSSNIENNKYYEETTEREKLQSEISPEYWR